MEVWKITFLLVVASVTMAMVASADSAAINLKQLFKAQFPETNPCLDIFRTAFRFPYEGRSDLFIQCEVGDAMTVHSCPEEFPYFDPALKNCTPKPITTMVARATRRDVFRLCGLLSNPCAVFGVNFVVCPSNPRQFLRCDPFQLGVATLQSCELNEVFDPRTFLCIDVPTAHRRSSRQAFSPPCTQEAIESGQLYHPYSADPHKYIQCDEWGNAYIRTCAVDYYFDPLTKLCVSSLVGQTRSTEQPFSDLCTQEAIQSGQLLHPYSADPHKYIQCNEWGGAYVLTCALDYYFDPHTKTCVSLVGRK